MRVYPSKGSLLLQLRRRRQRLQPGQWVAGWDNGLERDQQTAVFEEWWVELLEEMGPKLPFPYLLVGHRGLQAQPHA